MKIVRFLLSLALLVGFLGIPAGRVFACSCNLPSDTFTGLSLSDAVFTGRVTGLRPNPKPSSTWLDDTLVTLYVSQSWKGARRQAIEVTTNSSEAACGTSFEVGRDYLVFAAREGTHLRTGLCSGTQLLTLVEFGTKLKLGQGRTPKVARAQPVLLPLALSVRTNSGWNCRKNKVCLRVAQYACQLLNASPGVTVFCR